MTAIAADPFLELAHEPGTAPYDWCVPPDRAVRIAFAIRRDRRPAAAAVTFTLAPGGDRHQAAATAAGDHGAYRLYRVTLPAFGRELTLRYRFGFRAEGADAVWQWCRAPRTVLVIRAPQRAADIATPFLGLVDGRPVYGPVPPGPVTPSPERWRHRTWYTVMVDRFAPAPEGPRAHAGLGLVPVDPSVAEAGHGGTLAGLAARLDYLVRLGVGGLILSPVYVNAADGYHGYHPLHLFAVDPRLGTLADLRALVDQAHARGIAVLLDVIVNHLADALVWTPDASASHGMRGRFRHDRGDRSMPLPYPVELRDPDLFHDDRGDDLVESPLFGTLADLKTERGPVRALLTLHLAWWLAESDVDGFRFDAARHVDLGFWRHAIPALRRYGRAIGKHDLFLLGEHADARDAVVGPFGRAAGFSGQLDFPLFYRLRAIFADGAADLTSLAAGHARGCFRHRDARMNLAFLDNQDASRFFHSWGERFASLDRARSRLRAALALIMLGPAMPCLTYGTEQEFSGAIGEVTDASGRVRGHDVYVRQDMVPASPCNWRYGPVNTPLHAPFDETNPTFGTIRALARLRAAEPAFHRGDRHAVIDDEPWLIAWLMAAPDSVALVAINLGAAPVHRTLDRATLAPSLPAALRPQVTDAAALGPLFGAGATLSGGDVTLDLPAEGVVAAVFTP